MKYAKALIAVAVLAIFVVPFCFGDSDAALSKDGQCSVSGFNDMDGGNVYVTIVNDASEDVKVTVKLTEYCNADNVYASADATIAAESTTQVAVHWTPGSGNKTVDLHVYDEGGAEIAALGENGINFSVEHSIWKDAMTYVVIVIVAIIVIVVLVFYTRNKRTKSDRTMADRTFTKMHEEKVAKAKPAEKPAAPKKKKK